VVKMRGRNESKDVVVKGRGVVVGMIRKEREGGKESCEG